MLVKRATLSPARPTSRHSFRRAGNPRFRWHSTEHRLISAAPYRLDLGGASLEVAHIDRESIDHHRGGFGAGAGGVLPIGLARLLGCEGCKETSKDRLTMESVSQKRTSQG
jgi:hypothetical protein